MAALTVERSARAIMNDELFSPRAERQLTIAAMLTAARHTRAFARHTLQDWLIPAEQIETAALLITELVANAVKSTGSAETQSRFARSHDKLQVIHIRLSLFRSTFIIEVWDAEAGSPVPQEQDLDAEGGRGLFLVQRLSLRWNYYHPLNGGKLNGGKVVWCELTIAEPNTVEAIHSPLQLPKRPPFIGPGRPNRAMRDPEILQRTLNGLVSLDTDEGATSMT